ncbi:LbetaH domain-containing protein [Maribacter arenosus]|uniref:Colanic acid biosynthesis acetyltransferase n=1 Tax=Maribacter arenosus TaxID=1854708 RepID=A0ABR7VCZ2_9FLAO|nr:putative colanic acid biosynthesis acetyltransferase [Maribacter arenosus]MBD0850786.1 putative colanic acid biosynthesis acetyltransferase [Maribacter arenosus]
MDLSNYKEPKPNHLKRIVWYFINRTIFYCIPGTPLRSLRNLLLLAFGAKVPLKVMVYSSAKIWAPWNLEMDEHSCIGPNTNIYNKNKVVIGRHCVVSQGAYLCTATHDIMDSKHSLISSPILLKEKSWVAADVFVGPGVTIGEGAIVGARGVVFKDVDPWTVVGGNPAKFIKKREIKG